MLRVTGCCRQKDRNTPTCFPHLPYTQAVHVFCNKECLQAPRRLSDTCSLNKHVLEAVKKKVATRIHVVHFPIHCNACPKQLTVTGCHWAPAVLWLCSELWTSFSMGVKACAASDLTLAKEQTTTLARATSAALAGILGCAAEGGTSSCAGGCTRQPKHFSTAHGFSTFCNRCLHDHLTELMCNSTYVQLQ